MKILVHDYAGHPFQVQLSRQLAREGYRVRHAYAGALQTPRGELARRDDDPEGFDVCELPMDPDYASHKYSFRRRRSMEIKYGRRAAKLIAEWQPDLVLSSNTPTETQKAILDASKSHAERFVFWCQDFYSIAVDKLVLELEAQLEEHDVTLELTTEAREWIAERGYDPKMGARPMARVIQEQIKRPLAEVLLFGELSEGGDVLIELDEDTKELRLIPTPNTRKLPHISEPESPAEPG